MVVYSSVIVLKQFCKRLAVVGGEGKTCFVSTRNMCKKINKQTAVRSTVGNDT